MSYLEGFHQVTEGERNRLVGLAERAFARLPLSPADWEYVYLWPERANVFERELGGRVALMSTLTLT